MLLTTSWHDFSKWWQYDNHSIEDSSKEALRRRQPVINPYSKLVAVLNRWTTSRSFTSNNSIVCFWREIGRITIELLPLMSVAAAATATATDVTQWSCALFARASLVVARLTWRHDDLTIVRAWTMLLGVTRRESSLSFSLSLSLSLPRPFCLLVMRIALNALNNGTGPCPDWTLTGNRYIVMDAIRSPPVKVRDRSCSSGPSLNESKWWRIMRGLFALASVVMLGGRS